MLWFHCSRCGSLFQAAPGNPQSRPCTHCGADSCATGTSKARQEKSGAQRTRDSRKKTNRLLMPKLIGGWMLVLAVILIWARIKWPTPASERNPRPAASEAAGDVLGAEDAELYRSAANACRKVMQDFLAAETPEAASQFVFSPLVTAPRMTRFLNLNPKPEIDSASLVPIASGLLSTPAGKAFEARWKTENDRIVETVFLRKNGEWRLDWEHYARYSGYPWLLFLSGSGPDEAEFRLLARERLADERKDESTISLALYAPRFGMPQEIGHQSPEFLVPRDSSDGKLLEAAFKLARGGGTIFRSRLPSIDPAGMIRVRVKVRRMDTDEGKTYQITAVRACHWLSLDDPGVDPAAAVMDAALEDEAVPQETR
jgi:hypothetical protein